MMRRQNPGLAALLLVATLFGRCQSDGQKLHELAANFPKEFFKNFPDSASVAGQPVAAAELLAAPAPPVFAEKKAFLEKKLAALQAIDAGQLDEKDRRAHQFLTQKTAAALGRMSGDLSLFDPLPVLRAVFGEGSKPAADLDVLVGKLPGYFASVKLLFEKKERRGGAAAIENGVELFRFLSKLKNERPQNPAIDTALVAVKDWVAFCK